MKKQKLESNEENKSSLDKFLEIISSFVFFDCYGAQVLNK